METCFWEDLSSFFSGTFLGVLDGGCQDFPFLRNCINWRWYSHENLLMVKLPKVRTGPSPA